VSRKTRQLRKQSGSVTLFVIVSLSLFFFMLGVSIDMMTEFEAINRLEFAAQSAALYGLSLVTDTNNGYQMASSQQRVANAIVNNTQLWNTAPLGPKNGQGAVLFAASDVQPIANPAEAAGPNQEFFLQVTARRGGENALTAFFLPLLYINFNQTKPPPGVSTMSPYKTVEVIGQPATRIGPGAPLNAQLDSRAADLAGFATFPLALNDTQFEQYAKSATSTSLPVDLVASFTSKAQANHVQGAFVDLSSNPGGATGFGSAGSTTNLQDILRYFAHNQAQNLPPSAVERGSELSIYSLTGISQSQTVSQIRTTIASRAGIPLYLPVMQGEQVVGFARGTLAYTQLATGTPPFALALTLASSLPSRNASSATGYSSNSSTHSTLMPAPPIGSVFQPRSVNFTNNLLSTRSFGVVLAPSLSPRTLPPHT
jgi:hypothetical protein